MSTGNDPGQTQYKILQATPSGYLVDFGDGEARLVPEKFLVDQKEANPTPGMYEQHAQFGGSPSAAKMAEAAQYTTTMQQELAANGGGAQPSGPTPMPAQAGGPPPQGSLPTDAEWMAANPNAVYDADPNGNGGQPPGQLPGPWNMFGGSPGAPAQAPAPSSPGAGYNLSGSDSFGWKGVTDTSPYPTMPNMEEYTARIHGAAQGRTDAIGQQNAALTRQGELAVEKQQALAPLQAQVPEDVRQQQERTAAFDATVQEYVQGHNDRIMQRMAAVPQENPSRIWSSMPAWQSALGLLSAVTGGMLAVTTGSGKNMGLEAIERAIERDVAAQRTNIDNEWKRIATDERSLEAYRLWKSRDRQNMLEEGILRREAINFQITSEAAKYDSLSKKAEAEGLVAANTERNMKDLGEIYKADYERAFAVGKETFDQDAKKKELSIQAFNAETARGKSLGGAGAGPQPAVRVSFDQRTNKPIYIPADIYETRGKASVDAAANQYKGAGNFLRKAQQLKDYMDSLGAGFNTTLKGFGDEQRDQANAMIYGLAYELAGVDDRGVKSKSDIEAAMQQMGNPETYMRRGGSPVIDNLIRMKRDDKQALIKDYGFSDDPNVGLPGVPMTFSDAQTDIRKPTKPVVTSPETAKVDVSNAAVGALTEPDPEQRAANMLAILNVTHNDDPSGELKHRVDNSLNRTRLVDGALAPVKGEAKLGGYPVGIANVRQATKDGVERAKAAGRHDVAERLQTIGHALEIYLINREKELSGQQTAPVYEDSGTLYDEGFVP